MKPTLIASLVIAGSTVKVFEHGQKYAVEFFDDAGDHFNQEIVNTLSQAMRAVTLFSLIEFNIPHDTVDDDRFDEFDKGLQAVKID